MPKSIRGVRIGARRGAPPSAILHLKTVNEKRHEDALKRGSIHALATERQRQRAAALTADAAAGAVVEPAGDATPPPKPSTAVVARPKKRRSRSSSPPIAPPPSDARASDAPPPSTTPLRILLNEGMVAWARDRWRRRSS